MHSSRLTLAVVVVLALAATVAFADVYSGELTINAPGFPDDYLDGNNFWADGPTYFRYWVTDLGTGYWHYKYELEVPAYDISHLIIEVSDNFTAEDLFNPSWSNYSISNHTEGMGNPWLPDSFRGIKFDDLEELIFTVEFESWRIPVWGDFYAKCGLPDTNAIWNTGFTNPDSDPTDAYTALIRDHILVPDTIDGRIPEPGTLALLGLGLGALGAYTRRRQTRR